MLDFFKDRLKRKAFEQALKEVEQETTSTSREKQTRDTSIQRVYKSEVKEEEVIGTYKIKSPLSKPETSAIDLKHFKDWRKVDKVESKQPKYIDKRPPLEFKRAPDYDDVYLEEEFDEPKKKLPGGEFKKPDPELEPSAEPVSTLDLAREIYPNSSKEQKDMNASSYIKDNARKEFGKMSLRDMLTSIAPDTVENYENRKKEEEKKIIDEEKKKAVETRIKVEVVDFDKPKKVLSPKPIPKEEPKVEEKKEPQKEPKVEVKPQPKTVVKATPKPTTKKTTTRKPRGKSKKRFDADVISAVNWKKSKK